MELIEMVLYSISLKVALFLNSCCAGIRFAIWNMINDKRLSKMQLEYKLLACRLKAAEVYCRILNWYDIADMSNDGDWKAMIDSWCDGYDRSKRRFTR